MDFARDALTFFHDRGSRMQPSDAQAVGAPQQRYASEPAQQAKPPCLVELRIQIEAKCGFLGAPDSGLGAGADTKSVVSWRKIGVVGYALCS
ncbi:MAG TPA: hypothetical protein VK753_11870, partial [Xanthomonadaceae bacterium]|nr:hypothetical protein [Xanthomonadaceae bacterium]